MNKYNKKRLSALITSIFLTPSVFAVELFDVDVSMTVLGITCQPLEYQASGFTITNGILFNTSNKTQTVICPLVSTAQSDHGSSTPPITVKVADRHSTKDISCHVQTISAGGVAMHYQIKSTSGWGASAKTLQFSGVPRDKNGTYYVQCSLPPVTNNGASGVVNIRVDEDYDSDI